MTLPVRAGIRVTRFALRTGVNVSARALALASNAVKSVSGRGSDGAADWSAPRDTSTQTAAREREPTAREPEPEFEPSGAAPERERTGDPRSAAGAALAPEPPPTVAPPAPSPPPTEDEPARVTREPGRVSEEPALVEEFAEPGAEDGAGASVHVNEPWDGYAELSAREVTARLSEAGAAELAAVQLYESTHKRRETVLSAVARELRIKSASTAPAADQVRKEQTNGN